MLILHPTPQLLCLLSLLEILIIKLIQRLEITILPSFVHCFRCIFGNVFVRQHNLLPFHLLRLLIGCFFTNYILALKFLTPLRISDRFKFFISHTLLTIIAIMHRAFHTHRNHVLTSLFSLIDRKNNILRVNNLIKLVNKIISLLINLIQPRILSPLQASFFDSLRKNAIVLPAIPLIYFRSLHQVFNV